MGGIRKVKITETVKHGIGERVKFAVGDQQGVVTGICLRKGAVYFLVTWAHDLAEKWHNGFELEAIIEPTEPPGFKA